ncbi:TPA: transcriptional regulator, partial [Vibrio cholerae]
LSGQHTIRTLALPLIDEASVSTFSFTYPTDFNLERFMREHDGISTP